MYFEFCPESEQSGTSQPFCIVREIEAVVCSQLGAELAPKGQYKAKKNTRFRPVNRVVEEGVPPER